MQGPAGLVMLALVFASPVSAIDDVVIPKASFTGLVGTGETAGGADDFVTNNGLISIKTSSNRSGQGRFTGRLLLGVDSIPFKGKFSPDGTASVGSLTRKNSKLPAVTIELSLIPGDLPEIVGRVVSSEKSLAFVALTPRSDLPKRQYTMGLKAEGSPFAGHGFLTAKTTTKGSVRLIGKLADGARVSQTTVLSDGAPDGLSNDNIAPVFVRGIRVDGAIITDSAGNPASAFRSKNSLLVGELLIEKVEPATGVSVDHGGQAWVWVRPTSPSEKVLEEVAVKGRSFAVTRGTSIVSGTAEAGSFVIAGLGALVAIPDFRGLWPATNKPSFEDKNYRLRFRAGTGSLLGLVKTPKIRYEGVMFDKPIELVPGQPVHGAGFRLNRAKTASVAWRLDGTTPEL